MGRRDTDDLRARLRDLGKRLRTRTRRGGGRSSCDAFASTLRATKARFRAAQPRTRGRRAGRRSGANRTGSRRKVPFVRHFSNSSSATLARTTRSIFIRTSTQRRIRYCRSRANRRCSSRWRTTSGLFICRFGTSSSGGRGASSSSRPTSAGSSNGASANSRSFGPAIGIGIDPPGAADPQAFRQAHRIADEFALYLGSRRSRQRLRGDDRAVHRAAPHRAGRAQTRAGRSARDGAAQTSRRHRARPVIRKSKNGTRWRRPRC